MSGGNTATDNPEQETTPEKQPETGMEPVSTGAERQTTAG